MHQDKINPVSNNRTNLVFTVPKNTVVAGGLLLLQQFHHLLPSDVIDGDFHLSRLVHPDIHAHRLSRGIEDILV